MMRSAVVRFWSPREKVAFDIEGNEASVDEGELRALDPQLAPYPFPRLEAWKRLTGEITPAIVQRVIPDGKVDGMTLVEGEKDELGEAVEEAKRQLRKDGIDPTSTALGETSASKLYFPKFDLKRSWKDGASGDEVTRWSRDKSQLWARVAAEVDGESEEDGLT